MVELRAVELPLVVALLPLVVEPPLRAVVLPLAHLPARPQARGGPLRAQRSVRPNR